MAKRKKTSSKTDRVMITARIQAQHARALRVAVAERSIDRVEPYTQQAILEAALEMWLRKHRLWSKK